MEQIAKMFGSAILVGICFGAMFGLLNGTREDAGLLETGGAVIKSEWKADSNDGFETYQASSKHDFGEVLYVKDGVLSVGTYELSELFTVTEANGETAELTLLSMVEPGGVMKEEVKGATELTFSSVGIYQLKLQLEDSGNRTTVRRVQIPVSGNGGST